MNIDIQHIAKLAKLDIPEESIESFAKELGNMIRMVEHLPDINEGGTLIDHGNLMKLREDIVLPSLPRDEILQNAPQTASGCFLVPKTVV